MKYIREKLSSSDIKVRIKFSLLLFFALFIGVVIISYFLLPEGLLKGKIPAGSINLPNSILNSGLKIFFYNMISVVAIVIASLFNKKKESEANYISIGYNVFFVLIILNATILGTWSFGIQMAAPYLFERIIGIFDIFHKASLWEMIGQLFITTAIAHIGLVLTDGNNTITRSYKDIRLSKIEMFLILIGILLMFIGAFIESISISNIL